MKTGNRKTGPAAKARAKKGHNRVRPGMPYPVLRWSTDEQLRIVSAASRGRTIQDAVPAPGQVAAPASGEVVVESRRANSVLDRSAHLAALRGEVSSYRVKIGSHHYFVEVFPRTDSSGRIVGTKGVARLVSPPSEQPPRPDNKTMALSMELARSAALTARQAADIRTRRFLELQHLTEEALLRTEADERRARFLADASAVLDATSDPDAALDRLGELVLQRVAGWWLLQIREGEELRRAALRAKDPSLQEFLLQQVPERMTLNPVQMLHLSTPLVQSPAGAWGWAQLLPDLDRRALPASARAGSFLRVPVTLHGRTAGVLTIGTSNPDESYGTPDLRMANDLALRIALAQESSRLYREAQREISLRKEAEARLLKFNAELERRVSDRTLLLQEANREAHSFAYTVYDWRTQPVSWP